MRDLLLKDSGVDFREDVHAYALDGVELQGITGRIRSALFADEYAGIPQKTLERAAERGTAIHSALEMFDELGDTPEEYASLLENYAGAMAAQGLEVEASEYIVTDRKVYATAIDKVCSSNAGVVLADVKTVARLDLDYVGWQLSVNAEFFEAQNPGLQVAALYAIHVKKDFSVEIVQVRRRTPEEVRILLYGSAADLLTLERTAPLPAVFDERAAELIPAIARLDAQAKEAKAKADEYKSALLQAMEAHGVKKIEKDGVRITYIAAGQSETFDKDKALAFLTDEQASACVKITKRKSSIKISSIC